MFSALRNSEYFPVGSEIGRGRFGTVRRCVSSVSGSSAAVKTIDRRRFSDPLDRHCLANEAKILALVSGHRHVIGLLGVHEDAGFRHVVTELCCGGDLFARLTRPGEEEDGAREVICQLAEAVAHCHRLGVAHRDIKPDNILFDSRNKLKLADFGSAEWFFRGGERLPLRGIVGTPYYVAPEVLAGREYNEKADVWSVGVILYVMLAGFAPFYGETPVETFEAVLRANLRFPTRVFRSVSPEAKDLLRKMICKDVSKRLSAEQVLRHPWIINGGDTESMSDMT